MFLRLFKSFLKISLSKNVWSSFISLSLLTNSDKFNPVLYRNGIIFPLYCLVDIGKLLALHLAILWNSIISFDSYGLISLSFKKLLFANSNHFISCPEYFTEEFLWQASWRPYFVIITWILILNSISYLMLWQELSEQY